MSEQAVEVTEVVSGGISKAQLLSDALIISVAGHQINLVSVSIILIMFGVLFLFWRIQTTKKLDFADLITKDGKAVSLTKVLQLIGGLTATWIMIKLTMTGELNETLLGVYLAYVGGIEAYSKFVAAKYAYNESSVNDPYAPSVPIEQRRLNAQKKGE